MPIDPGRHWLEAGITGLARQREWDAVVTSQSPGNPGKEVEFVALQGGDLLVGDSGSGFDATPLAAALEGAIEPPYRAVAVRRPELWVVGACAIQVAELVDDPGGDTVEVVESSDGVASRIDGVPTFAPLPELERLGRARFATYVVRARRLSGRLFEVAVEPL